MDVYFAICICVWLYSAVQHSALAYLIACVISCILNFTVEIAMHKIHYCYMYLLCKKIYLSINTYGHICG